MRIAYQNVAPEVLQAVLKLQQTVSSSRSTDAKLRALVTMRASQINRCAFCLEMHARELREMGESEMRIDCLPAWNETELYSEREKAALAWTEALTNLSHEGVTDDVYERAKEHFDEHALVELTLCVATINVWNRLNVAFQTPPGAR